LVLLDFILIFVVANRKFLIKKLTVANTKIAKIINKTKTMNKKTQKKEHRYSFEKGWSQVTVGKMKDVRAEIMALFEFDSLQAFRNRKKGLRKLEVHHYNGLVEIFGKYGITEIWGK